MLKRRGSDDTAITSALQRAVATSEAEASDGRYLTGDVRWHVPFAEVAIRPTPGDDIVDAAETYWKIIDVREDTLTRRWRLVCRDLSVAFGLDDTIQIEQTTITTGDGGAAQDAWKTLLTGVRARIQGVTYRAENRQGQRRTDGDYTIYMAADLPRDQNDELHTLRVVDKRGIQYRIDAYRSMERIGELAELECKRW